MTIDNWYDREDWLIPSLEPTCQAALRLSKIADWAMKKRGGRAKPDYPGRGLSNPARNLFSLSQKQKREPRGSLSC